MSRLSVFTRAEQSIIGKRLYSRISTMSKPIQRVTLFKIAGVENQKKLIEYYKAMPAKAVKVGIFFFFFSSSSCSPNSRLQHLIPFQDGKPYIKSVTAGLTKEDQRNQGYTVAAISVFESEEDMAYYDNGCAAHAELKAFAGPVKQGVLIVYFENEVL